MKNDNEEEAGIAILELLIASPFLFILIIGVIDIGRLINQYLLLNYAVSAGVLEAMSQPNLTPGKFVKGTPNQICPSTVTDPVATPDTQHQKIQERVINLVQLTDRALSGNVCVRSTLQIAPTVANDPREKTVTVEVFTDYNALFPLFNGLPIVLQSTGPYLVAGR